MADVRHVKLSIQEIYERRKAAVYAIALRFAALAINDFRARQATGEFWENQTTQAMRTMFTLAFVDGDAVGFLMAHFIEYGPYLEKANNGKNEAIRPIMNKWAPLFISAVSQLYSDI